MATPLTFDIIPHVGIGPVLLGMTLDEVRMALADLPGAFPEVRKGQTIHCYFDVALQVSFGQSKLVEFIGVYNTALLLCKFEDHDVFDLPGPELFSLIASKERSDQHKYNSSEYLFPDQIVTLYEADEQYDRKRGELRPVFMEVGVGNAEYLAAIEAINARYSGHEAG